MYNNNIYIIAMIIAAGFHQIDTQDYRYNIMYVERQMMMLFSPKFNNTITQKNESIDDKRINKNAAIINTD